MIIYACHLGNATQISSLIMLLATVYPMFNHSNDICVYLLIKVVMFQILLGENGAGASSSRP